MRELWREVRLAARGLAKTPALTAVAVLMLALGIGANATVFAILDPLLLRPLPVANPGALIFIGSAGTLRPDYDTAKLSELAAYRRYRDEGRGLAGVLAFAPDQTVTLAYGGGASPATGEQVSGNYFTVLGLRAFAGRLIAPGDAASASAKPVAVLSYDCWRRTFHSDPAVIGQTLAVTSAPGTFDPFLSRDYRVVGIAPPGFFGAEVGKDPDLYMPFARDGTAPAWVTILARLAPGVSLAAARARLAPIFEESARASSLPAVEKRQDMARLVIAPAGRGLSSLRGRFTLAVEIAMAMVALVLLIACANIANLLRARGIARRGELAVRVALGAGPGRLARAALIEAALLALAGAVAGVAAAGWSARGLAAALSTRQLPIALDAGLDARVALFCAGALAATVLLSGAAPALAAARVAPSDGLRISGYESSGRRGPGGLLLAAQAALCVIVLAGAGLLLRSLANLEARPAGFDADRVLAVTLEGKPAAADFDGRLLQGVAGLPGVRAASYTALLPLSTRQLGINLIAASGHLPLRAHAFFDVVAPGYFSALGIPLLRGRDFNRADGAVPTPRVAIVNRTLAEHFFPGADPIGRTIETAEGGRQLRVIGIVADSVYNDLREAPTSFFYMPFARAMRPALLIVRAGGRPAALAAPIRRLVRSLDPAVSASGTTTLRRQLDDSLHEERLITALCGVFAMLALALACAGVYGVLSFQAARGGREIGIRLALGARPRDIIGAVAGGIATPFLLGIAAGIGGALALTRLLAHLLFGVNFADLPTYAAGTAILAATALLAAALPLRRALRTDPASTLRAE